jgi:hypothetical protein
MHDFPGRESPLEKSAVGIRSRIDSMVEMRLEVWPETKFEDLTPSKEVAQGAVVSLEVSLLRGFE